MTNRSISRHFHPSDPLEIHRALAKSFLGYDPFSRPTYYQPHATPSIEELEHYAEQVSQYKERTKDGEGFTVYTQGDYPKLRVVKELDSEKRLEAISVYAAIPGVLEDEVSVNILGQEITIEVAPKGELDENTLVVNELPNRYSKVVVGITGPFRMEGAVANYMPNGMLHIFIPAVEKPKSRKIAIGTTEDMGT